MCVFIKYRCGYTDACVIVCITIGAAFPTICHQTLSTQSMRTSPGAEIEHRSSSGAQIERWSWNRTTRSTFNEVKRAHWGQPRGTESLAEPYGAIYFQRDLLSTNLLAREQCMNTLQNYQQINEHLTKITNSYEICTETSNIYNQSW